MEQAFQRVEGNGKLSLVRKLAEVMAAVERVPKSGRNKFHNYDYATEADIVAAVRVAMAERQVMMVPTVLDTKWGEVARQKGGNERLCTLTVRFTLHDGESGEQLAFDVLGEGTDTGDKASYKAMTGAVKYALLKLFLIPTGDDPEEDSSPASTTKGGQQSKESGSARPPESQRAPHPAEVTNFPKQAQAAQSSAEEKPRGKPAARRSLEDARKLDRSKELVGFGKHKSVAIAALTHEQLGEALDEGEAWVKAHPDYWNLNKMRNQIDLLSIEYEAREKAAATRSAPVVDDVPF